MTMTQRNDLKLAFVVPAFNESQHICECLDSIQKALRATSLSAEIIVVDNGSTDNTSVLAVQSGAAVISISRDSVSAARNKGAFATSAHFIAFIDADVVINPCWMETFQSVRAAHPKNLITGFQYLVRENGSWIEETWFKHLKDRYLNGGNIIISRDAFHLIQGFDTGLKTGEDYDLCERAIAAGIHYAPNPGFEAVHLGFPRTISHFMKRECWHGEGDYQSLSRFLQSPVALIAMVYLALHASLISSLLLGAPLIAAGCAACVIAITIVITIVRFRPNGLKQALLNCVGNYLYFCARAMSGIRALLSWRRAY